MTNVKLESLKAFLWNRLLCAVQWNSLLEHYHKENEIPIGIKMNLGKMETEYSSSSSDDESTLLKKYVPNRLSLLFNYLIYSHSTLFARSDN